MLAMFSSGLLFLGALLCGAASVVYDAWPLLMLSVICMLCAYCALTFED